MPVPRPDQSGRIIPVPTMTIRRVVLGIVVFGFVLVPTEDAYGGAAKPRFIKVVIERQPYRPMPGVPPAEPADVLLDGLNAAILEHYRDFTLAEIHVDHKDTLAARAAGYVRITFNEDFDKIYLNTYVMDARDPKGTLPPGRAADPPYGEGQEGTWLIQFMGPIKSEWMDALKAEGVVFVQYVSYHAYVVGATARQIQTIEQFRFVQWTSPLHTFLKPFSAAEAGTLVHARVAVVRTSQIGETLAILDGLSRTKLTTSPFSEEELSVVGVFRGDHLDHIRSLPLVFFVFASGHADATDIPAASPVSLIALAVAAAAVALLKLRAH